jgi:hypothetical protein
MVVCPLLVKVEDGMRFLSCSSSPYPNVRNGATASDERRASGFVPALIPVRRKMAGG